MRPNGLVLPWSLPFLSLLVMAAAAAAASGGSGRAAPDAVKRRHHRHHGGSFDGFPNRRPDPKHPQQHHPRTHWGSRDFGYEPRGMTEMTTPFVGDDIEAGVPGNFSVGFAPPTEEEPRRNAVDSPHSGGKSSYPLTEEDLLEEEEEDGEDLCSSSVCSEDLELRKHIRIQQIKNQILKETGITSPPNMTGFVLSQNPHLQSIISEVNEETSLLRHQTRRDHHQFLLGDDPNIGSEKVFVTATRGPTWVKIPENRTVHYFSLGREHSFSIAMAKLHFWLKPSSIPHPKNQALITISKVERSKYARDFNRLNIIIDEKTVSYNPKGIWAKVDIFSLVHEWLVDPETNLGVEIRASTMNGIPLEVDTADDDPSHAPLLELDVKEERNDRRKRFANNRECSDKKVMKQCCLYPLIIDFLMYKFDFIIAPKTYEANYCRGECPFLFAHKLPHSTVLQQLFKDNTTKHGPCCGARDLSPLKMLYFDGRTIKVAVINDMVVKQCSCN